MGKRANVPYLDAQERLKARQKAIKQVQEEYRGIGLYPKDMEALISDAEVLDNNTSKVRNDIKSAMEKFEQEILLHRGSLPPNYRRGYHTAPNLPTPKAKKKITLGGHLKNLVRKFGTKK
jgi:hypothetical protein